MANVSSVQPFHYDEDCTSTVEISMSCTNLAKMDLFSQSDPFITLYQKEGKSYRKIGQTEVKKNNSNPKFEKIFQMQYHFEEEQLLKFVCEDYDRVGKNDFIGECQVRLGELASSGEQMEFELKHEGKTRGKIKLCAEEISGLKSRIIFTIQCQKLDKMDFFGKSDPFFEIRKIREDKHSVVVYKSEVIKNTLNPTFRTFEIGMFLLCSGDTNTPLKFDIFDWNQNSAPDTIGTFTTSLAEIERGREFHIINQEKQRKKGAKYKNSGIFQFLDIKTVPVHTFVEHLKGGLQIQLMVAIDYTGSNGNPADSRSLHFIGAGDNEYMEAINSVGNILVPYDSDQKIPVFGFGAKLPPNYDKAHHFFNLNGQDNPEVNGVEGIIAAYKQTLSVCRLSGPTKFGNILSYAKEMATNSREEYSYIILLIITDGVIDDMTLSSDLIVESSVLPLSIVIVGVGGADFTNMHRLDADEIPLVHSKTGVRMKNDIVQFVPMREVKANSKRFDLAKEVLAEVPGQVTSYMNSNHLEPRESVARAFKTSHGQAEGYPPYPVGDTFSGAATQQMYATPYPQGVPPQQYGYGPPGAQGGYPPYPVGPSAPPPQY